MSWWQESTPVGDTSNLTKFLNFLSQAEGADYNTIVGGSKFNSFDAHPGVVGLRTKEGPSTAAGRYQITKTTYDDVAPRLGIKDFSPQSQDAIAIELIRRGGAYDDVVKGNFESAINKLGGTWASLPSSPYSQPKKSWADVNRMLGVQVASNNASEKWWAGATPVSDAPSNDNWWAGATPVQQAEPTPQAAPARPQPAPAAAAPAAAPQPAKAPAPAPAAPQRTAAENFGLGTRNVLEGVEQAFTYPVRAVGEAASGIAGLLGRPDLADTISRTVGMKNRGAGALVADAAGLAKPETKTEKIVAEGTKAAAGLLSGTVVNKAAEKAPEAVRGVLNMVLPGTSGSATQVAKDVGVYGGLGAAMEAAPAETAAGLAVLGAGKAAAGRVIGPKVSDVLDTRAASRMLEASGAGNVRQDAEIFRRMAAEFNDPLRTYGGVQKTLTTKDLNGKISQSFLRDADGLVSQLPKDFETKGLLQSAITKGVKNTAEELAALRNVKGGEQVADLIEAAKRTEVVTAAVASTGGIMPAVRYGVQKVLPGFVSEPVNAILGSRQTREAVGQKAIDKFARGANKIEQKYGLAPSKVATEELGGIVKQADNDWLANVIGSQRDKIARQKAAQEATAAEAARKAAEKAAKAEEGRLIREGGEILKQKAAEARAAQGAKQVAARSGGKAADPAASIADLQAKDPTYLLGLGNRFGPPRNADQMAEFSKVMQNQMEARAQRALANREVQKTVSELAKGPQVDPRIQVLQDSRRPLSGAFQELLQGGRSGLNMTSDQAIEALRLTSRQFKDRPLGQAAQDILRSGNVNDEAAFYGLQNQLRKLQERGVVAGQRPGALSAETGRIFNQTSYDATVRTAEAARDAAIKSAPSPSLKQFAIDIANEKNPALKVEKLQSRVKATTDPEELGYLLNMVDPLTKFGKKAKK